MELSRDEKTYRVIGAAMEVHSNLGSGFLEYVYHEALKTEFKIRNIPFVHELTIPVFYKGSQLNTNYRADFLCFNEILIEVKAISKISRNEKTQVINYLKATGLKSGLLVNFGSGSLQYNRSFN